MSGAYEGLEENELPARLRWERAGRVYSVPAGQVRGVESAPPVTRMPGSPPGVVGLVRWQGGVLALVEPGETEYGDALGTQAMVVLHGPEGPMALCADRVLGWVAAPDGEAAVAEGDEIDVDGERLHAELMRRRG